MATVHFAEHTIQMNVAYVGAPQAGCGSNVRHLHRSLPARDKAELRRVGGKDRTERMWHFAYEPVDAPRIPGFTLRIRVASVPAGVEVGMDRDAMLTGLDALVFVADARANRSTANVAALLDTEAILSRHGVEFGALPTVLQVNQTDAPNARPVARVAEELNSLGFPVFDAMARQGRGVLETHEAIVAAALTRLRDGMPGHETSVTLTALTEARREAMERAIHAHTAALPQAGRQLPSSLGLPAAAELPVRLAALRDSTPLQHVRSEVRNGRLRVSAVYQRSDGDVRKLTFVLEGAEEDLDPVTSPVAPRSAPTPAPVLQPRPHPDDDAVDLPPLTYGLLGVAGGLASGLLLGYIWFW